MTSSPSTIIFSSPRFRNATCNTARPSVPLIVSPVNIFSVASFTPQSFGQSIEHVECLLGNDILGIVDQKVFKTLTETPKAFRVLSKQIFHVPSLHLMGVHLEFRPG